MKEEIKTVCPICSTLNNRVEELTVDFGKSVSVVFSNKCMSCGADYTARAVGKTAEIFMKQNHI